MRHVARLVLLLALPATAVALSSLPARAGAPLAATTAHLANAPLRARRLLAAAPGNTAAPVISGHPVPGSTLTASAGTWNGGLPQTFVFQWSESDDGGATWTAGGTGATFVVPAGVAGRLFQVGVTATNAAGSATAFQTVTSASPPVFRVAPTLSGALLAGSTLTVSTGSWAGSPTTYAYAWARCDASGTVCGPPAVGPNSYLVVPADVGSTLKATVTAGSASGSGTASVVSGVVTVAAPADVSLPFILGRAIVGATLTVSPGYWAGSLPQTIGYQWIRFNLVGAVWVLTAVVGTGSTYVVPAAAVGGRLAVEVTMTNSAGSFTAYTPLTDVVVGAVPINTVAPTFSATLLAGATLTVLAGTWTGPPTSLAYGWARCNRSGGACTALPLDGQGSSHVLTYADVGHTLKATVTGSNLLGACSVSVLSGVVTTAPPHSDSPPLISIVGSGVAQVGSRLTASPGGWSGALPDTYPFAWQSSPDGVVWTSLGAAGPAYTVPPRLVGFLIRVVVAVSNPAGTDTGYSVPTASIEGAPWNLVTPRLSSADPSVGTTLTGSIGAWAGATTFGYQWQHAPRCTTWTNLAGATTSSYVVGPTVATECLRLVVTAFNTWAPAGTIARSPATAPVLAGPVMSAVPTLAFDGTMRIGATVTATPGACSASPKCTFAYRWQISTDGVHWTVVDAAATERLVVTRALFGGSLRVAVTAANSLGNVTVLSAPLPLQ